MTDQAVILLVEDNTDDAFFAQRALRKAGISHRIIHLRDGEEAINYFAGKLPYNDRSLSPLPALVLLDLKMPKYSGFDVLRWLQSRPELAHIPVVVLSSSIFREDRERATKLGAVGYEMKPLDTLELLAVANALRNFLPNRPPSPLP